MLSAILGDPGAASQGDGIIVGLTTFSGESLQQARACCKLSPENKVDPTIPSPRLAAPGSPWMAIKSDSWISHGTRLCFY